MSLLGIYTRFIYLTINIFTLLCVTKYIASGNYNGLMLAGLAEVTEVPSARLQHLSYTMALGLTS